MLMFLLFFPYKLTSNMQFKITLKCEWYYILFLTYLSLSLYKNTLSILRNILKLIDSFVYTVIKTCFTPLCFKQIICNLTTIKFMLKCESLFPTSLHTLPTQTHSLLQCIETRWHWTKHGFLFYVPTNDMQFNYYQDNIKMWVVL